MKGEGWQGSKRQRRKKKNQGELIKAACLSLIFTIAVTFTSCCRRPRRPVSKLGARAPEAHTSRCSTQTLLRVQCDHRWGRSGAERVQKQHLVRAFVVFKTLAERASGDGKSRLFERRRMSKRKKGASPRIFHIICGLALHVPALYNCERRVSVSIRDGDFSGIYKGNVCKLIEVLAVDLHDVLAGV